MGTEDLEPDSHERTGARVPPSFLFRSNRFCELFSDTSDVSPVLDRQGRTLVAVPVEPRTLRASHHSHWLKIAEIVVMSPTVIVKNSEEKRSHMATVPFVLGRGSASHLGRQTLLCFGTRVRKDLVDPLSWQETQVQSVASTGIGSRLA